MFKLSINSCDSKKRIKIANTVFFDLVDMRTLVILFLLPFKREKSSDWYLVTEKFNIQLTFSKKKVTGFGILENSQ